MVNNDRLKFYFATAIMIFLIVFLLVSLKDFFNAFFGAFLIFFLFKGLDSYFTTKLHWHKQLSASIILFIITLVILIPLFLISSSLVTQFTSVISNPQPVIDGVNKLSSLVNSSAVTLDLSSSVEKLVTTGSSLVGNWVLSLAGNIFQLFLNLIIFYFTLYFLLVSKDSLQQSIEPYFPFNKKNSDKLLKKFKDITYSTVVASGLIALLQGTFMGVGFWIFGLPNPLMWGIISLVISFLPAIGIPIIWIPTVLIQFLVNHNSFAGFGMLIWGALLSISDSFLRPLIQKKIGRIHPLITIVGVFIGLPLFGILGLFIGPLLIAYTMLIIKMYSEEYGDF